VACVVATSRIAEWDQLACESTSAFQRFAHYRDEGLTRSLSKTAQAFGLSKRAIEKLSSRHYWRLRVHAWDSELDRQRQLANIEAQREMVQRHARLARAVQSRALERLLAINPSELTPTQVIQMLERGVKIERISLGAPTEYVNTSTPEPILPDEEELDDEELAGELRSFLLGLEAAAPSERDKIT
jgi:hypothetical protein